MAESHLKLAASRQVLQTSAEGGLAPLPAFIPKICRFLDDSRRFRASRRPVGPPLSSVARRAKSPTVVRKSAPVRAKARTVAYRFDASRPFRPSRSPKGSVVEAEGRDGRNGRLASKPGPKARADRRRQSFQKLVRAISAVEGYNSRQNRRFWSQNHPYCHNFGPKISTEILGPKL